MLFSFVNFLVLVVCCLCSSDVSTDPNYVQEHKRVRNANLTALVAVDGIPDCALVNDVVAVLTDINFESICLHCEDASFFDRPCLQALQTFKRIEFVKIARQSDILISLSSLEYPSVSAEAGSLFRMHIFQEPEEPESAQKMTRSAGFAGKLRGYDSVLFAPLVSSVAGSVTYARKLSQHHLNLGKHKPAVLPVYFGVLSPGTDRVETLRSVLLEGVLTEPFTKFVRWNLPSLRKCEIIAPPSRANVALIVEPREHPHLEFVVRNVLLHLNKGGQGAWKLQIHFAPGPDGNEAFLQKVLKDVPNVNYVALKPGFGSSGSGDYNTLLKDRSLWEQLQADGAKHTFVFQSDSLLIGTDIFPFLKYDFIGAPWHITENAPSSEWIRNEHFFSKNGGAFHEACCNGGLSLRNTEAMVKIVHTLRSANPRVNEDVYFSRSAKGLALRVPARRVAYTFVREILCDDITDGQAPYGLHNAWVYMNVQDVWSMFRDSMRSLGLDLMKPH